MNLEMQAGFTDQHRDALHELLHSPGITPQLIRSLRIRFGEAAAHRLLKIVALQPKARQKFGAGVWWVTARGLQQATVWQVADLKATWFGGRPVVDLCCGVGGDLVRLARRGGVLGVDSDPEIVAMAAMNLREVSNAGDTAVVCGQASLTAGPPGGAMHVDPDRRSSAGRSTAPDRFCPSWAEVQRLLDHSGDAIAKLAPATRLEDQFSSRVHRCWIALGSSVREQSVLVGETIQRAGAIPGARSAIVLRGDGRYARFAPEDPDSSASEASSISDVAVPAMVMVDPHASIRAAGLTGAFAKLHRLHTLGGPSGFLTGDETFDFSSLAYSEPVIWTGSSDHRGLRRALRQLDAEPVTAKIRGVDLEPSKLLKRLAGCGEQPVTLWIGRHSDRVYAAITTSLAAPSRPPGEERGNRADPQSPEAVPPRRR